MEAVPEGCADSYPGWGRWASQSPFLGTPTAGKIISLLGSQQWLFWGTQFSKSETKTCSLERALANWRSCLHSWWQCGHSSVT